MIIRFESNIINHRSMIVDFTIRSKNRANIDSMESFGERALNTAAVFIFAVAMGAHT